MSVQVTICFHGELNDFLPPVRKASAFTLGIGKIRSVKDLIESIGVPHTEIDIILVNNESVGFDYRVTGNEAIQVYPSTCDAPSINLVHNQANITGEPRFVLDVHLGKLAVYLRMLGFDTLYRNDYEDPELADISSQQRRILVTCDRKLLMRKKVLLGYFMRSRQPKQQVKELLNRYHLFDLKPGVARCMSCNGLIHRVKKEAIEKHLLPLTRAHYDDFFQCTDCKKIYWEGSHYDKMQQLTKELTQPS